MAAERKTINAALHNKSYKMMIYGMEPLHIGANE